jgi:aspartyl-tRNA(Asn)/glutamyl-tRNA(Gln) amidotransferase subunit C
MALTEKDVKHVAQLARLALTEEEQKMYLDQLGRILGYIENLRQLNTDDVLPTSHAIPVSNVWREDETKPFTDIESILKNAPEREDDFFKVKKVIE